MNRKSIGNEDRIKSATLPSSRKASTAVPTMSSTPPGQSVNMTSKYDRATNVHKKLIELLSGLAGDTQSDLKAVFEKTVDLGKLMHSLFTLLRTMSATKDVETFTAKEQVACIHLADLVKWTDKVVLYSKDLSSQCMAKHTTSLLMDLSDLVSMSCLSVHQTANTLPSSTSSRLVDTKSAPSFDSEEDLGDDLGITPYRVFTPLNQRPRSEAEAVLNRIEHSDSSRPQSMPDRYNIKNITLQGQGTVGSIADFDNGVRQRVYQSSDALTPDDGCIGVFSQVSNCSESLPGTTMGSDSGIGVSPLTSTRTDTCLKDDQPPPLPEKKKNRMSVNPDDPPPLPVKVKNKLRQSESSGLSNIGMDVVRVPLRRAHSLEDQLGSMIHQDSIFHHDITPCTSMHPAAAPSNILGKMGSQSNTDGLNILPLPPRLPRSSVDDQPPMLPRKAPYPHQEDQPSPPVPLRRATSNKSTPSKRQGIIHEKLGQNASLPFNYGFSTGSLPVREASPVGDPSRKESDFLVFSPGTDNSPVTLAANRLPSVSSVGIPSSSGVGLANEHQRLAGHHSLDHSSHVGTPPTPQRTTSLTPPALRHRVLAHPGEGDESRDQSPLVLSPTQQHDEPPTLPKKRRDSSLQPVQRIWQDLRRSENADDIKPPPVPEKRKTMMNYIMTFSEKWEDPSEQIYAPLILPHVRSASVSECVRPQSVMVGSQTLANKLLGDDLQNEHRPRVMSVSGRELNLPPPRAAKKRRGLSYEQIVTGAGREALPPKQLDGLKQAPPTPPHRSSLSRSTPEKMEHDEKSENGSLSEKSIDSSTESQNPLVCENIEYFLLFNEEDSGEHSLRGGKVDALVAYAASGRALVHHEADRLYCEAFLLTYRTFISPQDLIAKLVERHSAFLAERESSIRHHTISLLITVLNELRRPHQGVNELNEDVLNMLMEKVHQLVSNGDLKLAMLLRQNLYKKVQLFQSQEQSPAAFLRCTAQSSVEMSMTKFKTSQIAQQMAQLDALFFREVEVHEVLEWSMHQSEEKCPNLSAFTEHFNSVSNWCRTRVLESDKESEREKVAKTFIKVMGHLRKMNDFSSLLAILSAMDCAAVSRLPWSKSHQQAMEEHRKLIDSTLSFKYYRDALAESMKSPPCIPYLGLFLQDLTFLNIGNPNFLDDKKTEVNFMKRWRQFTILNIIRNCQLSYYEFKWDENILGMFGAFQKCLGEEELYQRSLQIKPRGT